MQTLLTDHAEIRQWVQARSGNPVLLDIPDPTGADRTLVRLTFDQHALNAAGNEGPDRPTEGFRLVDWDEWFAAFDAGNLALAVDDDLADGMPVTYDFVARDADHSTGSD